MSRKSSTASATATAGKSFATEAETLDAPAERRLVMRQTLTLQPPDPDADAVTIQVVFLGEGDDPAPAELTEAGWIRRGVSGGEVCVRVLS